MWLFLLSFSEVVFRYAKDKLVKHKKVEEATRERDFMRLVQHRLFVRLFATFQSQEALHFVFELCPHGDLVDWVRRDPSKKRSFPECVVVVRQLVEAVRFLHSSKYCHRDVKRKRYFSGSFHFR